MSDNVNHPAHYSFGHIEVIDAIEAWKCGFHDGNVIKYVARFRHKNGIEDLKKAQWYLNRLVQRLEQGNENVRSEGNNRQSGDERKATDNDHGDVPAIHSRGSNDTSGPGQECCKLPSDTVAENDGEHN